MPHTMPDFDAPETLEEAGEQIRSLQSKVKSMSRRMASVERLRWLANITAVLCMIAAVVGLGYGYNSRQIADDAKAQLDAQHRQIFITRTSTCASARSTSLAFREPQISSKGVPEAQNHFLDRMRAQVASLEAAKDLDCESLPEFQRFNADRIAALTELEEILGARIE